MKHFRCIHESVDITRILDELARQPEAWNWQTGRQAKNRVQAESLAIPIRGIRKSKIRGRERRDVHETRWTTTSNYFPAVVGFLEDTAREQNGELSRARIVNLPGGARVYPHVDRGEYYAPRDRYHLVLDAPEDTTLEAGGECIHPKAGELWWFDNKQSHAAENPSSKDRIHLIFDLLPREAASRQATLMASG